MIIPSPLLEAAAEAVRAQVRIAFDAETMQMVGNGKAVMLKHGEAETAAGAALQSATDVGYILVRCLPSEHAYVSTACWHGLCDERCRSTCKFCDAPCQHDCHLEQVDRVLPPPWVDQARDGFVRLLSVLEEAGIDLRTAEPDLHQLIRFDPAWFWARGEVQPPGEWRAP